MSLQADILRTEIEKLKHEKMNDRVAQLLSVYWCALQAVQDTPQAAEPLRVAQVASVTQPEQEIQSTQGRWRQLIAGKNMEQVADVMDQHFEVLSAIAPKHYAAVLAALDKI